ncbi:DUF2515 domain-containing protein [Paenibacillus harenae]|uniref:DUF2515 domain-containing protein n=1 Tax=Paenibacillus harenae TaxID=306543 RepID=A0ABT9U2R3_PAEHA|nr:DUF2515 domain-containing protein [Paenibacillus harenae]MDQ0113005.1 hypothetical protein [Paenibacillus harenae]
MDKQGNSQGQRRSGQSLLSRLLALPRAAIAYAVGKWKAMSVSEQMIAEASPIVLAPAAVARLTAAWRRLEEAGGALPLPAAEPWTAEELAIISQIRSETEMHNRNNVTRTEAYRTVYFRTPELHWALLAHLVSRNGGWNMTDLQGEWLPYLLRDEQREELFRFLERANALIFQDAYPQLLLYERSLREGRSLFHLLPAFGVSVFMSPVWRLFWKERDPVPLTVALIVNEQNYIEQRVIQNAHFKEKVLHTLFFGMQSLLQVNGVIFPYGSGDPVADCSTDAGTQLAGIIIERFEDLDERIEFGKRLYAVLFGIAPVLHGARCFAAAVKHTGSRADFAPQLYARIRQLPPQRVYKERLIGGALKPGAKPLYSPELGTAWGDRPVDPAEKGDWFKSADQVLTYFRKLPLPPMFELTNEYGLMLNKIELAVLATQRQKQ